MRPKPFEQTVFFTDRSLYRPGQTIQYKGLCLAVDQEQNNYKTIANRALTVIFTDPNNKEIARQQVKTNDYGSFSGSFTAPRDRLTGQMYLRVDGTPPGGTVVRVEEYKRPKFQVTLEAPKAAPRLNDKVVLPGKAMAYTGAAVNGAQVHWNVIRQVHYPVWWYWSFWWRTPNTASQVIAHGTALTEADGSFAIEFVARPDLSVPEKNEPTFHFTISADVTDTTGETRSGSKSINVGYTTLKASLTADDWQTDQKPVEITITTQTLDDVPQAAEGVLKVYHLKQPEKVVRQNFFPARPMPVPRGDRAGKEVKPKPDPSNPNSWDLGDLAGEEKFETGASGTLKKSFKLAGGPYRAILETKDRFGKPVTALLPIQVLQPEGKKLPIRIAEVVAAPKWTLEPGEEFQALWGTGYDQGRAFIEIEHRRRIVQAFWTPAGVTQQLVEQALTEAYRGGFMFRVTMVRENRGYLTSRKVEVPWTNKDLTIKWEHFTSKLEPAQKETWTAVITGPGAKKAVAEMVATLYDESLDAYFPHNWLQHFNVFYQDNSWFNEQFENGLKFLQYLRGNWQVESKNTTMTYRSFPADITVNLWRYQYFRGEGKGRAAQMDGMPAADERLRKADGREQNQQMAAGDKAAALAEKAKGPGEAGPQGPDLSKVTARKNLNETAFFFPHLLADSEGKVKLEFTMPEALTQWKFMSFANDKDLRSGSLQDKVVTAKDLMVQPNPPRFLREDDILEFTVKVSNQANTRQEGTVRLTLADARTGKSVDAAFDNTTLDQTFDIPAKESKSFAWHLKVPDGQGPISYKAVGSTGRLSDGEEGYLPVLSRRILVTESLPLPIRGPGTKTFDFTKLEKSGASKTLVSQSLTVQMVSNPAWYAVMALPYLMDYPYECSEQVFNRLYANSLARHIATSDPKIQAVFEQWKGTPALDSPLEKNQDLKAVTLEETPWLRQAQAESQARKNVGILFDSNRLNSETAQPAEIGGHAVSRWGLAVVPRWSAQRLHDAVHHHWFRPPAAPGRQDRHGPGHQVAGPARRLDRSYLSGDPQTRQKGRQPPVDDDCPVPVWPQLLPPGQTDRPEAQGGRRLFPGPGPHVLAAARRAPVAGAAGPGFETLRRQGNAAGYHAFHQTALGQHRGDGHVLARPGTVLVVVPRSDRDPGRDDRGL